MTYDNVIWEGRFQPVHRGHVAYVKMLLDYAKHVWIFVVENERSADVIADPASLPVPEFTAVVDTHHGPEKNPLPFWLRYRLVMETLRAEFGPDAPITVWGGRRLDLMWPFYAKTLPPNRIFLTPDRDDFEDVKAAAWAKLGEQVKRVQVRHMPQISATLIRERLEQGEPVAELLCPKTEELLYQFGYYPQRHEAGSG